MVAGRTHLFPLWLKEYAQVSLFEIKPKWARYRVGLRIKLSEKSLKSIESPLMKKVVLR